MKTKLDVTVDTDMDKTTVSFEARDLMWLMADAPEFDNVARDYYEDCGIYEDKLAENARSYIKQQLVESLMGDDEAVVTRVDAIIDFYEWHGLKDLLSHEEARLRERVETFYEYRRKLNEKPNDSSRS